MKMKKYNKKKEDNYETILFAKPSSGPWPAPAWAGC